MVGVRAAFRLRNDLVHNPQLFQIFRRDLHGRGGGFRFRRIAPDDRSAPLRRNHRIETVFQNVDTIADGNGQGPARAPLARHRDDHRHSQPRHLSKISRLRVPVIVTVTGEGGSGGALAIAVGDRVNILENSFYSVISPEGCASIIWRDSTNAETAAAAMKITAKDLKELAIVDEIVAEPEGGAHTDHEGAARFLDEVLDRQLAALTNQPIRELLEARYEKFRKMGQFFDLGN